MARVRTQKAVAGRIDLNYHRRWHPWRATRVTLVVLCALLAAGWVAYASIARDPRNPSRFTLTDRIHNPGPVARAHASFENDCRACHDGSTPDGSAQHAYWQNVSDQACLNCHDGSAHHANQKLADAHGGVAGAAFALAVKDGAHPHGMRSASCVSCHVEHRGHDALVGVSDQLCIDCHVDVNQGLKAGAKPSIAVRAVRFDASGDHPRFGRLFAAGATPGSASAAAAATTAGGGWVDKTDLKFGHALHALPIRNAFLAAEGKPPMTVPAGEQAQYLASDCLACHEMSNQPVRPSDLSTIDPGKWEKAPPPYVGFAAGGTSPFTSAGDGRYAQPVSFDRHCAACHVSPDLRAFKAPSLADDNFDGFGIDGFAVPHHEASVVRTYVESAVKTSFAKFESDRVGKAETALAAAQKALEAAKAPPSTSPAEPAAPAEPAPATPRRRGRGGGGESAEAAPPPAASPPAESGGGRRGRRGGGGDAEPAAAVKKDAAGWIKAHTVAAVGQLNGDLSGLDAYKDRTIADTTAADAGEPNLDALVDVYTALVVSRQCVACHSMTGEPPALDAGKNAEHRAARTAFATAPTGIPDAPRRWFPASTFDHFAHRQVDCRGCHAPAWSSGPKENGAYKTATAHVLTSDLDGSYPGAAGLNVPASADSCVSCHVADTAAARGAGDACITCHWYHDQKLARPPTGSLVATPAASPTTRPAAAPAAVSRR